MKDDISLLEVVRATEILKTVLQNLFIVGVYVNFNSIDWTTSAVRAIKNERENGPAEEDNSARGIMEKYARFASQAVTFSDEPAFEFESDGSEDAEAIRCYVTNRMGSCAFWEEGMFEQCNGKKQVKHSDLMVTDVDEIKVGKMYLCFYRGKPTNLIDVTKIVTTGENVRIEFVDWKSKQHGFLYPFDQGITPYSTTGKWNVVSWLEPVDDVAVAEPETIDKSGLKECNWLRPVDK